MKDKAELTTTEKKLADRYRSLYTIGFLSIVGGLIGVFLYIPTLFYFIHKKRIVDGPFWEFCLIFTFILILTMPVYGFFLRRYKRWCYLAGIILYSCLVLMNILDGQLFFPVLFLYFLYCLISPPSRQIFHLSGPGASK